MYAISQCQSYKLIILDEINHIKLQIVYEHCSSSIKIKVFLTFGHLATTTEKYGTIFL